MAFCVLLLLLLLLLLLKSDPTLDLSYHCVVIFRIPFSLWAFSMTFCSGYRSRCQMQMSRRNYVCYWWMKCNSDTSGCMKSNRLQSNPQKAEVLWCTTSQRQHQLPTTALSIDAAKLVHDLGIYIAWSCEHTSNARNNTNMNMNNII